MDRGGSPHPDEVMPPSVDEGIAFWQEQMFDAQDFEDPSWMGEHPDLTREEYIRFGDRLHDAGGAEEAVRAVETGLENHERLLGRAMLLGEIDAAQALQALRQHAEQ